MSVLFSPVQLGPIEVRNRAWVSPMCQYSCEERDGMAGDWHREHLTSFARGGAGLVMTEAAAVEPIGRISPHDLGLWNDAQAEALAPIAARIRAHGAVPGVQLAHAGRKASIHREWSGRGSVPVAEGGWPRVLPTKVAETKTATEEPASHTARRHKRLSHRLAYALKRKKYRTRTASAFRS